MWISLPSHLKCYESIKVALPPGFMSTTSASSSLCFVTQHNNSTKLTLALTDESSTNQSTSKFVLT